MSPEQNAQGVLTTESDVYSIGVVLSNVLFDWRKFIITLVILIKAQVSLSSLVISKIREGCVVSFIDLYVMADLASECFIEVLDIAFHCLMEDRYARASMTEWRML